MSRIRSHGLRQTLSEVDLRTAKPVILGYSAAGVITGVGERITDLAVGQRVAAAGSTFANHADTIAVPRALVSPIPEGVSDEEAAFTTLGAIALHAHRLSGVSIGARVAVIGLGVIGQLSCQLASAAGCSVWATDPSPRRCAKGKEILPNEAFHTNVNALESALLAATGGEGADAVIIAAGTSDATLANRCIRLLRDRGSLIVIGSARLNLDRDLLYQKEVAVVVSRSYGPGRYDDEYELRGVDYPIGHVRWTEGRNFAAVLDLLARQRLDVRRLTTAIVPVESAQLAYELAESPEDHLGILFDYGREQSKRVPAHAVSKLGAETDVVRRGSWQPPGRPIGVALVGPGSFAMSVLGPALLSLDGMQVRALAWL